MKNRGKNKIAAASAGLILCMAMAPAPVYASEADNILQAGGVAAVLEAKLSTEEYIELAQQAQGAAWGYTNIGIANVESGNLNVREIPSTDGKMVGKMPKNSACEVLEISDGWAHIQSGEVEGYVNTDYLLTGPDAKLKANEIVRTVVVVNGDGLNVREQPDTESAILTQVASGEEMDYLETLDGWIKVAVDADEAYVSAEYVTVEEKLDTAVTMSELLYGQDVSDLRVDIAEYAKQFLGNAYVYGGSSLTNGTDCSGFTMSIYKHFGIKLSHSASAQSGEGTKISASELQPGDLVFYADSSGHINHVALYIGGGKVIHASSPSTGIKISNYKYRTPVKYVSILRD